MALTRGGEERQQKDPRPRLREAAVVFHAEERQGKRRCQGGPVAPSTIPLACKPSQWRWSRGGYMVVYMWLRSWHVVAGRLRVGCVAVTHSR